MFQVPFSAPQKKKKHFDNFFAGHITDNLNHNWSLEKSGNSTEEKREIGTEIERRNKDRDRDRN